MAGGSDRPRSDEASCLQAFAQPPEPCKKVRAGFCRPTREFCLHRTFVGKKVSRDGPVSKVSSLSPRPLRFCNSRSVFQGLDQPSCKLRRPPFKLLVKSNLLPIDRSMFSLLDSQVLALEAQPQHVSNDFGSDSKRDGESWSRP